MPLPVAGGLFGEIGLDGGRQVHARLVGQAYQHPQYVGHLVGEVFRLALLERLVAVFAGQLPTSSVRTAILVSSEK